MDITEADPCDIARRSVPVSASQRRTMPVPLAVASQFHFPPTMSATLCDCSSGSSLAAGQIPYPDGAIVAARC